jgi:hypothetical protein
MPVRFRLRTLSRITIRRTNEPAGTLGDGNLECSDAVNWDIWPSDAVHVRHYPLSRRSIKTLACPFRCQQQTFMLQHINVSGWLILGGAIFISSIRVVFAARAPVARLASPDHREHCDFNERHFETSSQP